jgi:hypothetical protein
MDEETRRRLAVEVQFIIANGLPFEDGVVAVSPTDYTVRGVPEVQFDLVDDAIEAYTDGDSFDKYLETLKKNKDRIGMREFFNWLVTQYGSALSQVPRDEAVIAKWLSKVEQVDRLLQGPSS